MKKGFTLVELLAVIIILGIVATITTPIILNFINSSKTNALLDDANSLIKISETYYSENTYNNESLIPVKITFASHNQTAKGLNKQNVCTSKSNILNYGGESPETGNILITSDGKITLYIYNSGLKKCVYKGPNDKTAKIVNKTKDECQITTDVC